MHASSSQILPQDNPIILTHLLRTEMTKSRHSGMYSLKENSILFLSAHWRLFLIQIGQKKNIIEVFEQGVLRCLNITTSLLHSDLVVQASRQCHRVSGVSNNQGDCFHQNCTAPFECYKRTHFHAPPSQGDCTNTQQELGGK